MITVEATALRVVAAFDVDRRLPRVAKPKAPGNSALTIFRSRDERAEIEAARHLAGIVDEPAPIAPSREELAAMEATFARLPALAEAHSAEYEALKAWAIRTAGGRRSIRSIAKDMGTSAMTLLRRKDKALSLLAEGLT